MHVQFCLLCLLLAYYELQVDAVPPGPTTMAELASVAPIYPYLSDLSFIHLFDIVHQINRPGLIVELIVRPTGCFKDASNKFICLAISIVPERNCKSLK